MFKTRLSLLRGVVVCFFVIGISAGLYFRADNADARISLEELLDRIEALEAAVSGDTFVVTSNQIPVPPGALQVFGYAECPAGSVVTGGGYSFAMFIDTPYDPSLVWVKQSRPQGSFWTVEVWNIDDQNPQPPFTVYAICLPR